jgi:hypothetical protein
MSHYAPVLTCLLAFGCSSFDDDVVPEIVAATIELEPAPGAPPAFDVRVELHGGTRDRAVDLVESWLTDLDNPGAQRIYLAAELAGFDGEVGEGEIVVVRLVNTATTAAELGPLCVAGRSFGVRVSISPRDEPEMQRIALPAPVSAICPGG